MKNPKRIISDGWLATIVVVSAIIIDQLIKVWVKTNMTLHESIRIFDWFYISFIENNGMAYGMQIGSKLVLSLFRVAAISLLVYYLWQQVRKKARIGYIVCLSMVLAGAIGNLVDCMFYGLVFNASSEAYTSYFVPFGTGYAPFLMGKVVDMFYFGCLSGVATSSYSSVPCSIMPMPTSRWASYCFCSFTARKSVK